MPRPRYSQISLSDTPYYHCVSRCVRRAFLCGTDSLTGQCYEHRRQWIEDKILELSSIFSLDICAYAVMSNHYHIVLHVDSYRASNWSLPEVIDRWHRLFKGHLLSQRFIRGEHLLAVEMKALKKITNVWRKRLMDISWFMRVLNESVARDANLEDHCSGRFWEGRYKCQALLDDQALLTCMAYVDLNPIRACLATTPESSEHTSVKRRIEARTQISAALFPFVGNPRKNIPPGLPLKLTDYIELVEWTGRIIRDDKRGAISHDLPPALIRLQQDPEHWLYLTQHFESQFKGLVGAVHKLKQACSNLGYQRTVGISRCQLYFT